MSQVFKQQLKRERERRSWSQAGLAAKVGVDAKTVSRWENGSGVPRHYHRQELCKLFNMSPEELGLFEDEHRAYEVPQTSASVEEYALIEAEEEYFGAAKSVSAGERDGAYEEQSGSDRVRIDWGEAPHLGNFCGREQELDALKAWVVEEQSRLVTILGMGGVGKTTLAAELVEQVKESFEYVFWRSLQNAPPLENILKQSLQFLAGSLPPGKSVSEQIELLIEYLREHRCLFVLDNAESIMQEGQRTGQYQKGYEDYGMLLKRAGEARHNSCLLVTSREKPKELSRMEGQALRVQVYYLVGMGYSEGKELLKDRGLFGTEEQWRQLINLYAGNPLALKLVSQSIEGIFEGDIARFLEEEEAVFGDIQELLEQHFQRLSRQEQEILYWLAVERESVSLEQLRENFVSPLPKGVLFEGLSSLRQRSLIETRGAAQFTLQPVVMEYVTGRLIEQVYRECIEQTAITKGIWADHAFLKAQAKDYVRESQARLILDPLANRLVSVLGKEGLKQRLRGTLAEQRQRNAQQHNYIAGNILNLLIHLRYELQGEDFSALTIWQAYVQNATLRQVNFANAHFIATVFTNMFGNIHSVSFSASGKLLATGTATGAIWLYRVEDGQPLLACRGHTDGVWSLAFSVDETTLFSSSDDQTIRVWDTSSGECRRVLQEHTNRVRAIALSETILASGSDDQTIRLWNSQTGELLRTLQGHTSRIWSVAFSPDGEMLASGSTDGAICLWETKTWQCSSVLNEHSRGIRALAFSPDGKILASGSDDQTVRLWEVENGRCVKVLQGHVNKVWSVAFSPDGKMVASGSEDQSIRLWDAQSYLHLRTLQNHTRGVRAVAFHPDGRMLASGGDDQTARLWDGRTGYCLRTMQGYTNRVWSIAFSPDGKTLASGSEDQHIRLWDVEKERCLYNVGYDGDGIRAIGFSPMGQLLASGGGDQMVRLWHADTGRCIGILKGHSNWVWSLAFSPDGKTLASGSEDQTIRLWNIEGHTCRYELREHRSWIRTLAFSPDGKILASGGDDATIRLWDVDSGNQIAILADHSNRIRAIAFSPDGRTLASGSEDQTIRLWDVESQQCYRVLTGHMDRVRTVAFSPDGKIVASAGEDQTILLWDVASGECLSVLKGHRNRIRSICFNADGRTLASASDDGTIKLWAVAEVGRHTTLMSPRPYEGMNIVGAIGLTDAQRDALKALGAIEDKEG